MFRRALQRVTLRAPSGRVRRGVCERSHRFLFCLSELIYLRRSVERDIRSPPDLESFDPRSPTTMTRFLLLVLGSVSGLHLSQPMLNRAHSPLTRARVAAPLIMDATFVADPSFNLAAGSAILGTICGGLEDLKDGENKKLPTAPLFGLGAIVFVLFGAFIAFQTATLRFTFDVTDRES